MQNILNRWMKAGSELKRVVLPIFLSLIGAIIVLYPSNPNNSTLPSRDSGVFLYVGWRLINGDIPYRDVWDHKPPLIYFVDALGLTLTPDSLWGVWAIQFVFIFLTIYLTHKILDREFGIVPAITGMIIMTTGLLALMEEGNVTEEYALLFQVLCLWLFIKAKESDYPFANTFVIGLCGGLAFYFKQTTIGIWFVYVIILSINRFKKKKLPVLDFLYLAAGWLIPIAVFALYFFINDALRDFWEQAFAYNFLYIKKFDGIIKLFRVFTKGFALLKQGGVLYFALAGWATGLIYLWTERKELLKRSNALIVLTGILLPVEVFLITISGRSIIHYYLTPLPVMAILGGIMVFIIAQEAKRVHFLPPIAGTLIQVVGLVVVVLYQIPVARRFPSIVEVLSRNNATPVINYVIENTDEDDKMLIIGAESAINFLTHREAPTRYVYQFPLNLTGNQQMFEEYIHQILADNPVLIIDTRGSPEFTKTLYASARKRSEIVRDGVRYLGENYERVTQFDKWVVYRLKEGQ